MSALTSLSQYCNNNIAGIISIKYAPYEWFDQLPMVDDQHTLPQSIDIFKVLFKEDYAWLELKVVPRINKSSAAAKVQPGRQGMPYSIDIGGIITSNNAALSSLLVRTQQYRHIVLIEDFSGLKKLYGTLVNPLTFSFSEKIDAQIGAMTGFDIAFSGNVPNTAKVYI